MLLAGNGGSAAQSKIAPTTQAQTPIPQACTADAFVGNNCCTMPSLSIGTNKLTAATQIGVLASSIKQSEPPKLVNSTGSSATTLVPAGIIIKLMLNWCFQGNTLQ